MWRTLGVKHYNVVFCSEDPDTWRCNHEGKQQECGDIHVENLQQ